MSLPSGLHHLEFVGDFNLSMEKVSVRSGLQHLVYVDSFK